MHNLLNRTDGIGSDVSLPPDNYYQPFWRSVDLPPEPNTAIDNGLTELAVLESKLVAFASRTRSVAARLAVGAYMTGIYTQLLRIERSNDSGTEEAEEGSSHGLDSEDQVMNAV
jgi:hypothetical protein